MVTVTTNFRTEPKSNGLIDLSKVSESFADSYDIVSTLAVSGGTVAYTGVIEMKNNSMHVYVGRNYDSPVGPVIKTSDGNLINIILNAPLYVDYSISAISGNRASSWLMNELKNKKGTVQTTLELGVDEVKDVSYSDRSYDYPTNYTAEEQAALESTFGSQANVRKEIERVLLAYHKSSATYPKFEANFVIRTYDDSKRDDSETVAMRVIEEFTKTGDVSQINDNALHVLVGLPKLENAEINTTKTGKDGSLMLSIHGRTRQNSVTVWIDDPKHKTEMLFVGTVDVVINNVHIDSELVAQAKSGKVVTCKASGGHILLVGKTKAGGPDYVGELIKATMPLPKHIVNNVKVKVVK